jgi:hypothetical protein
VVAIQPDYRLLDLATHAVSWVADRPRLEILRSLHDGVHVAIVSPDDEYLRLCDAVGGTAIQLGAPGIRVNPLDIPAADRRPDTLTRRALFLHTLIAVLLEQQPPPAERAALDRAIMATYAAAGISNDPASWTRPAPLLRDLTASLEAAAGPAAHALAVRLSPWTQGSLRELFDGPTTDRPRGHLVVWSTRQLADELRAPSMLLALDAIWRDGEFPSTPTDRRSGHPPQVRRLVVVDEAWTLLRDGEGAKFLYRLATAGRKRGTAVAVVTRDAAGL